MFDRIVTPHGRVLRAAEARDVPGIVAIETMPAMAAFLCAWPAERHLRNLADPEYAYVVGHDGAGAVDAFAIVHHYSPGNRWYELVRIAVTQPGERRGSDVLAGVLDAVFGAGAHRVQLDLYADNVRARRAYARAGFREEGVMRDAVLRGCAWQSLVLMAVLDADRTAAIGRAS